MNSKANPKASPSIFAGTAVAPGIGIGRALIRTSPLGEVPVTKIADREADREVKRFRKAVDHARRDLDKLQKDLGKKGPEHADEIEILGGHRACLDDAVFLSDVERGIREDKLNLEAALARVISNFARIFDLVENTYLKERLSDIREVASRILDHLHPRNGETPPPPPGPKVLVLEELRIADLLDPEFKDVAAIVSEHGARTAHATLMARSLRIPMVVGVAGATRSIHAGTDLLVDGSIGTVYPSPPVQVRREYEEMEREFQQRKGEYGDLLKDPCKTIDGKRIHLLASVANPSDLALVRNHLLDGIGLYRTEYPFVQGKSLPKENALVKEYAEAVEVAGDLPAVLRLLNVGSARGLAGRQLKREPNPALGRRSLRLLMADPEIFRLQVRAMARASVRGSVRILLPFVSDLDDLKKAKEFIRTVESELAKEGTKLPGSIPVGALIEVPGIVPLLPAIRREADFLCIGIDNLAQHLMVADRANGLVEGYLQMSAPGVLRTLKVILDHTGNSEVFAYGEMVRDPLYTYFLLGIGLERFCLPPYSTPRVKSVVLQADVAEAREFADELLTLDSRQEIRARLVDRAARLVAASERA